MLNAGEATVKLIGGAASGTVLGRGDGGRRFRQYEGPHRMLGASSSSGCRGNVDRWVHGFLQVKRGAGRRDIDATLAIGLQGVPQESENLVDGMVDDSGAPLPGKASVLDNGKSRFTVSGT
jgi:hypothetical protein